MFPGIRFDGIFLQRTASSSTVELWYKYHLLSPLPVRPFQERTTFTNTSSKNRKPCGRATQTHEWVINCDLNLERWVVSEAGKAGINMFPGKPFRLSLSGIGNRRQCASFLWLLIFPRPTFAARRRNKTMGQCQLTYLLKNYNKCFSSCLTWPKIAH